MCSTQRLDEAHRAYSSAYRELLAAIAEVERDGVWHDGSADCAAWLSARYQVSYSTARGWVTDAAALAERPDLDAALDAGSVSSEQMRAIATVTQADPSAAGTWLETLADWPIESLQREARKTTAQKLERRDEGRYLTFDHTPDERFVRIRGQVHPEEGALLMKAVDRAVPSNVPWFEVDRHRVEGLLALARTAVAEDADPDRATIVVHVSDDSVAELESGGYIGALTAERLACDARIEAVIHNPDGYPSGIGRASRNVPAWMYRQLRERDRTCVFPGCTRRGYLHAHHIKRWRDGGHTDLDNLILVCTYHHQLLHERGWSVEGVAGPGIMFARPDGTPYRPRAPTLVP